MDKSPKRSLGTQRAGIPLSHSCGAVILLRLQRCSGISPLYWIVTVEGHRIFRKARRPGGQEDEKRELSFMREQLERGDGREVS